MDPVFFLTFCSNDFLFIFTPVASNLWSITRFKSSPHIHTAYEVQQNSLKRFGALQWGIFINVTPGCPSILLMIFLSCNPKSVWHLNLLDHDNLRNRFVISVFLGRRWAVFSPPSSLILTSTFALLTGFATPFTFKGHDLNRILGWGVCHLHSHLWSTARERQTNYNFQTAPKYRHQGYCG